VETATLDAAQRGDRKAQGLVLRDMQDPWYRMCLSLLGNADSARDATQETALRFLKQLPAYRGQSSLMTWSIGIAINVVREMRRARARTVSDGSGEAEGRPAPGEGPIEAVAADEAREAVRTALAGLPERQREAVMLRFFEELSVEETAAAMGCAAGTVKATVFQALRAMRKRVGQLI
jgi:RNA polymerase sigma-70 factor (ECF subfamily)